MNRLTEEYSITAHIVPQSVAGSAAAVGTYTDVSTCESFCVSVLVGAVADGKSISVDLMTADNAQGTGAREIGTITYLAPAGGCLSHVITAVGSVSSGMDRYLAARVRNQGTAAVLLSATMIAGNLYHPAPNSATTLVV